MADVTQPQTLAPAVDAMASAAEAAPVMSSGDNSTVQVNAVSVGEPLQGVAAHKKKRSKVASLADSDGHAGESTSAKPSRNLVKWDSQPLRMLMLLNAEKALWDLVKDKNLVYTLLAKNVYGNLGEAPTPEATEQRFAKWRSELRDGGHIVPEMIDKRANTLEFARQQRAEQSGKPAQQVAAGSTAGGQTQQQNEVSSTPRKSQHTTRGAANRRNSQKASGGATSSGVGAGGAGGDGDDSDSDTGRRPPPNTPMGTPKKEQKKGTKKRRIEDSDDEGCSPPMDELSSSDTSDGEFGVSVPKKNRGKKRQTRIARPKTDSDTEMGGTEQTAEGYQANTSGASQYRWGIKPRESSRTPSVDRDAFTRVGRGGPSEQHVLNSSNNIDFSSESPTPPPTGRPRRTRNMSDEPYPIGSIQAQYMEQFKNVPTIAPENEPAEARARQQSSGFISPYTSSSRVMNEPELQAFLASRSRGHAQPLATGARADNDGFKIPDLPASASRRNTRAASRGRASSVPKQHSKTVVLKIKFFPLPQASQVHTEPPVTSQPMKQEPEQVTDLPGSQTSNHVVEQLYKQELDYSVDQPLEQEHAQVIVQPHAQIVNQAIDRTVGHEDQAIKQLSNQTVSMAINQNNSQETDQDTKNEPKSIQSHSTSTIRVPEAVNTSSNPVFGGGLDDAHLYAAGYPSLDSLASTTGDNDFENAFVGTEPHSYLDDYMEYGGGDLGYDPFAGEEDPALKFELRDLGFPIPQESIFANSTAQMQQVPATAGMTAHSTSPSYNPFSFNPTASSSQSATYIPNSVPTGDVNDFKVSESVYGDLVDLPFSDMTSFIDTNVPVFYAHGAYLLPEGHPWAKPHACEEKMRTKQSQEVAAHLDRLGNYRTNFPLAGAWLQQPHNSDVFVFVAGFNDSWESIKKEVVRRPLHYFATTNQWYDSTTGAPQGVYGVPSADEYDFFGLFGAVVSFMARNGVDFQPPFPDAGWVARNMGLGVGGDAPGMDFPPVAENQVLQSTNTSPPS